MWLEAFEHRGNLGCVFEGCLRTSRITGDLNGDRSGACQRGNDRINTANGIGDDDGIYHCNSKLRGRGGCGEKYLVVRFVRIEPFSVDNNLLANKATLRGKGSYRNRGFLWGNGVVFCALIVKHKHCTASKQDDIKPFHLTAKA